MGASTKSLPCLPLQRLPTLLLLVICCLAALLSRQGAAAATSATTSSADDRTATHTTSPTCVPLQGIESNATGALDASSFIDFDVVRLSLTEDFDMTNPVSRKFPACQARLETPISMRSILVLDTALFPMSSMFHTNVKALDIFGDKETSDARRRCQPDEGDADAQLLFDLHLRVTIMYTIIYSGVQLVPTCMEEVEDLMEERGYPLSLVMQANTTADTPWGLAKAYVTESLAYMNDNDGWNADGSKTREFNRIPFSDYAAKDSAGNTWTPYQPQNSPYKYCKPPPTTAD